MKHLTTMCNFDHFTKPNMPYGLDMKHACQYTTCGAPITHMSCELQYCGIHWRKICKDNNWNPYICRNANLAIENRKSLSGINSSCVSSSVKISWALFLQNVKIAEDKFSVSPNKKELPRSNIDDFIDYDTESYSESESESDSESDTESDSEDEEPEQPIKTVKEIYENGVLVRRVIHYK